VPLGRTCSSRRRSASDLPATTVRRHHTEILSQGGRVQGSPPNLADSYGFEIIHGRAASAGPDRLAVDSREPTAEAFLSS
jgi:hypothetical protein